MDLEGVPGDEITLLNAVSACAALGDSLQGKQIHARILSSGLGASVLLSNSLVYMYGKCGSVEEARNAFDRMPERDLISWNAMITVYAQHECGKQAIQLYAYSRLEGTKPDEVTFASLLNACFASGDLKFGRMLHEHFLGTSFVSDQIVCNGLISMYSDCGSLDDATAVFEWSFRPDVCTWTTVIAAYTRHGKLECAFATWSKMHQEGLRSNEITFLTVLDTCSSLEVLETGKHVHRLALGSGLDFSLRMENSLISMYGKCSRHPDEAREVFLRISRPSVISWSAFIAAYGQHWEAIKTFELMNLEGVKPNATTLTSVLRACATVGAHEQGRRIHALVLAGPYTQNTTVLNAAASLYAKCSRVADASRVFSSIPCKDAVSWNAIVSAYAKQGLFRDAIFLSRQMQVEGFVPDDITFITILYSCSQSALLKQYGNSKSLTDGRQVHSQMISNGLDGDTYLGNLLVQMYGRCGSLDDARAAFQGIHQRNVFSWTILISLLVQNGEASEGLELLKSMDLEGTEANKITFISLLGACSVTGDLSLGKTIHERIRTKGLESDIITSNALLNMYTTCESLDEARLVFERMVFRDVVSWTIIISAYAHAGYPLEALQLYRRMEQEFSRPDAVTLISVLEACASLRALVEGKAIHERIVASGVETDVFVGTAVVSFYGKCEAVEDARQVFDRILDKDIVCWNAMIGAYAQNHCEEKAFALYLEMVENQMPPNDVTLITLLDSCSSTCKMERGSSLHREAAARGYLSHTSVVNALINMYAKCCGNLEAAQTAFESVASKNVVSWSSIVAAYARNGEEDRARNLFWTMNQDGVLPNIVTFTSVLHACSHAGLADEGWSYFLSMQGDHHLEPTPEHYGCMVNLLAKSGRVKQAASFMSAMPVQPDASAWRSLLGACEVHTDKEYGALAAKQLLDAEPRNSAAYVLLYNISKLN
ncbi:hypothetical protein SELMODRAFT_135788 [Selaginella moellendorffii]|uniref:Pentacotripeptide-repeat region of PRORP domain-containing protein n=1 Tax=Selaginella moellendorffii TaxID=88036 RepID=D8TAT0_SELML|nr:hypothetical protein SELMODRAFT_135788 [Selaginella moellendorffii]